MSTENGYVEPNGEVDEYGKPIGLADLLIAEKSILGVAMETDGACLDELTLTGDDFLDPRLGEIYGTARRMRMNGQHVTYATMLDAHPKDAALLADAMNYSFQKYALEEHAAIVAKQALRRRLQAAAAGLAQRAKDPTLSADQLVEQSRQLVDGAVGAVRHPVRFLRDLLPEFVDSFSEVGGRFVPTPWPSLDGAIGGFRPGCVYVIAGRPSQGKSVLAGQCAVALAKHGLVAFSSLEMSRDELIARFISARIPLNVQLLKDGTMSSADWVRFAERRRSVEDLPIAIDDRTNVTVHDIRQHARNVSRHGKLAGVVVDYMQLVAGDNPRADRRVQVDEASRQFKVLAKDLQIPVLVLSQINRDPEKRADPRPKLHELKESGAIEQDCDVAILIYRHGEVVAGGKRREVIDLDVAKNRHGPVATIDLKWEGALSRAVEWPDEEAA